MKLLIFYTATLTFLVLFCFAFKQLLRLLRGIRIGFLILLLAILLILSLGYWNYVPAVHRIYGDEPNLLTDALSFESQTRYDDEFFVFIYYNLYKHVSPDNMLAIRLNTIMSVGCLLLLFVLLYLLFQREVIGIAGVLALASAEAFIVQSTNSYTIIPSLLFALLSSIFFWCFLKTDNLLFSILTLFSLLFATMIRTEFFAIIAVYFLFLLISKTEKIQLKKINIVYWIKALWPWILTLPPFVYFFLLKAIESKMYVYEGSSTLVYGFGQFFPTLLDYFIPTIGKHAFFLFGIFLALSILWIRKVEKWREIFFLLLIPLPITLFYLLNSYYAPHFKIVLLAYYSFVWGIPFEHLREMMPVKVRVGLWIVFILYFFLSFFANVTSINAWTDSKFGYMHLSTLSPKIVHSYANQSCLIITPYAPNLQMGFYNHAKNANEIIADPSQVKRYPCLYFFEDYLCMYSREKTGMMEDCLEIRDKFDLTPVLVITDNRMNYTLYEMYDKGLSKNATAPPLRVHVDSSRKINQLKKIPFLSRFR